MILAKPCGDCSEVDRNSKARIIKNAPDEGHQAHFENEIEAELNLLPVVANGFDWATSQRFFTGSTLFVRLRLLVDVGISSVIVTREILLRRGYLTSRRMTAFLCVCVALAISAV